MSKYDKKILTIRTNLFLNRFKNELSDMNIDDIVEDNDRKEILNSIIKKYNDLVNQKKNGTQLKQYLDTISKNVYKKKWHALTTFHKSIKLKEYVTSLTSDKKLSEEIYSKLIIALKEKQIHTSKTVTYDVKNEKILNIKGFKFDKKTGYECSFK